MNSPIRIILADDHPILRESLAELLDRQEDFEVVATVGDGRAALAAVAETEADVAVMDLSMPELNGIETTRQIASRPGAPRILCLSIHRESGLVSEMLKAGASGYVLKTCDPEELCRAVRVVAGGETYLCAEITGDMVDRHRRGPDGDEGTTYADLTPREREVLQMIAEGNHTKAVAAALHISPKTVLAHREKIMSKTGAQSVPELVRYALRQGIAQL